MLMCLGIVVLVCSLYGIAASLSTEGMAQSAVCSLRGGLWSTPAAVNIGCIIPFASCSASSTLLGHFLANLARAECIKLCCLQAVTRKTRILDVVYNASNNELVRPLTGLKIYGQPLVVGVNQKPSCVGMKEDKQLQMHKVPFLNQSESSGPKTA